MATAKPANRILRLARRTEAASSDSAKAQAAIIQAAAEAFMEQGFTEASIDDVARRLGATKGLVYHYYRSKTDLFFDVCRNGMALDFAAVEPFRTLRERAVTRLTRMAMAHALSVIDRIEFRSVILQSVAMQPMASQNPDDANALDDVAAARGRYEAMFGKTIAAAMDEGDLAGPIAPALGAKALLAVLDAPVLWYRRSDGDTQAERQAIARDLAFFALRGAGAPAGILEEEF